MNLAYIIIFQHIISHDEDMKKKGSLGLSKDTFTKRKQRNVITLSGQFATFIVEILMSALYISGTVYIRTLRS